MAEHRSLQEARRRAEETLKEREVGMSMREDDLRRRRDARRRSRQQQREVRRGGGHSSKYIIVKCLHMPLQLVTRTLFNEFRIGMQLGKPIMV